MSYRSLRRAAAWLAGAGILLQSSCSLDYQSLLLSVSESLISGLLDYFALSVTTSA